MWAGDSILLSMVVWGEFVEVWGVFHGLVFLPRFLLRNSSVFQTYPSKYNESELFTLNQNCTHSYVLATVCLEKRISAVYCCFNGGFVRSSFSLCSIWYLF